MALARALPATFRETGTAAVNGSRLYYEIHGAGPPLLLLHGFGLDGRLWRPQLEALAERHLVVCYDARGFGRSELPDSRPYSHARDAADMCDYLGIGPVLAVGHGDGVPALLELAQQEPELVRGVVGLNPVGACGLALPPELAQLASVLRRVARVGGLEPARRLWQSSLWFRSACEQPVIATALEELIAGYSGWHWLQPGAALSLEPPPRLALEDVRAPLLVVSGARDLGYCDGVARALTRAVPGAQHVELPNVGHLANLEAPDAVTSLILRFASETGRSAPLSETRWLAPACAS